MRAFLAPPSRHITSGFVLPYLLFESANCSVVFAQLINFSMLVELFNKEEYGFI